MATPLVCSNVEAELFHVFPVLKYDSPWYLGYPVPAPFLPPSLPLCTVDGTTTCKIMISPLPYVLNVARVL